MFKKIFKNLAFFAWFLGFFGLNCMEQRDHKIVKNIKQNENPGEYVFASYAMQVLNSVKKAEHLYSEVNRIENWQNKLNMLFKLCNIISETYINYRLMFQNSCYACGGELTENLIIFLDKDFNEIKTKTKKFRSEIERLAIIKIQNMLKFIKKHRDTDNETKAIKYISQQLRFLISDYNEHLEHQFEGTDLGQLYKLYCVVNNLFSLKYVD
ncbi:hypothetical protein K9L05_01385 [Candidatus Babeliales bacterium]|nr:hypothetical protein [Candidatus Babeliales bacterium]MCF7899284.1 hypothetical protein [Candidatus Babeliales bacterium]